MAEFRSIAWRLLAQLAVSDRLAVVHVRLKQALKPIFFWSPTPCVCCGIHMRPREREVIWDALAEQWELTTELRRFMDQREGRHCTACGVNWRVRQLARVLLDDIATKTGRRYKT